MYKGFTNANLQRNEIAQSTELTLLERYQQYTTLMSPNKGETAVCGSTIFVWDDWGGDHWVPAQ